MTTPPLFKHQVEGIEWLIGHKAGLLGDQMRLGKTRQVIEAAQELWRRGEIDRAIVVAPAPVRDEWYDPDLGQIARFQADDVPVNVTKYQAKVLNWVRISREPGTVRAVRDTDVLSWVVTNYEFIRRPERLEALLPFCNERTILVLDESLAVKSPSAQQTKACARLRRRCGRIWLLNGTPEGDNPGDAFAQYQILDPIAPGLGGPKLRPSETLGCANWWQFRARYAKLGGFKQKQIVQWLNLDDLRKRTSPHTLRRTLDEVFDLPPALDPVVISVPLKPETWSLYQKMRKDAILYLEDGTVTAAQAGVKVMRLSQITSGFIGGVETSEGDVEVLPLSCLREVGSEKLDALLEWHSEQLAADQNFKVIIWCRFRAEVERLAAALRARRELHEHGWPYPVEILYGGMSPSEQDTAKRLLNPRTAPAGPAVVVGTAKTGGFGLNFAAASTMVYASTDYSLVTRRQSMARILGPDQKRPAAYFDVVATGPDGQKTVDHTALRALSKKEDIATWTAGQWARALKEE